MNRLRTSAGFGLLMVVVLLGAPAVASGQARRVPAPASESERPARAARTFGTTSEVSHTVQAFAFTGFAAADLAAMGANDFGARFCTAVACLFETPLSLPAGALVIGLELEGCDTSAAGELVASLYRATPVESSLTQLAQVATGGVSAGGCAFTRVNLATPETIDNFNNTYQLEVVVTGNGTDATRFLAVRVFYRLQVSPAPAFAFFTDVPETHPFYQFIEALRISGITSGCGLFLFCPDDPITRGQMAAFLAKALGLHFSP